MTVNFLRAARTSEKSEKARTHSTDIPMVFKKATQYIGGVKPSLCILMNREEKALCTQPIHGVKLL